MTVASSNYIFGFALPYVCGTIEPKNVGVGATIPSGPALWGSTTASCIPMEALVIGPATFYEYLSTQALSIPRTVSFMILGQI